VLRGEECRVNRSLSLYLDVLRAMAAMVVFLSHAGTMRISGGFLYQFSPWGQLAVDVFFVLSGLVIAHTVQVRESDARSYAVNRAARIYSVVLPALAIGYLLDAIGSAADPGLYAMLTHFHPAEWPRQVATSLVFCNEIWFNAVVPGTNLPFWSLGYEVWYYLIFGVAVFARGPWRWPAAVGLLFCAGPKIAMLFPLWLLGVASYQAMRRLRLSRRMAWIACVAPLLLLPPLLVAHSRSEWPFAVFGNGWRFAVDTRWDYALGLALAVHLVGVHALHEGLPVVPDRVRAVMRRIANGTFTVYLLHFPLIHFLVAVMPWPNTSWQVRLAVFVGAPLALLALSQLTEQRRDLWRRGIDALLPRRRVSG
jgi:peptidoglycan/LPS O-acetylase OafA/YrhL